MARSLSTVQSDPVLSYMDGVQVKIAEAYKPPRKIALPAAYNNKFPDNTKDSYDFTLEKSILEKWRKVRLINKEVRRARLKERKKREQEKLTPSPPSSALPANDVLPLPVKVAPAPETTILTPQRLSPPVGDLQNVDFNVKNNGLDYADFDNDTSSPFDNMELKTINDMEELAQVLQPTSPWVPSSQIETIIKELTLENNEQTNNHENEKINECNNENIQNESSKRRNISIIVEELQRELNRPHMENWKPWPDLESPDCDLHLLDIKHSNSSPESESTISNVLLELEEDDRKLAKHLNDMGFELSRAARAIGNLGGKDNKKVVEYLLAIQHLEEIGISGYDAEKALALNEYDQEKAKQYHENLLTLKNLGFTEDEASKALLKCDIDRDKALDFLCA
ncbi:hypothetical protein PV325_005132 [Microctonus aethiopoides]|nr:hypothetical protein PV325_005132 [Microctonus aethiopoides]